MDDPAEEPHEEAKILREIAELLPEGMTVGKALVQWKTTDPEKHLQLAGHMADLAVVRALKG